MTDPYAPPNEPAQSPPTAVRSLALFAAGTVLFVLGDSLGLSAYLLGGRYGLFGLMLPSNILGLALLGYALYSEREHRWKLLLSLGLCANLLSFTVVGLLMLHEWLLVDLNTRFKL